MELTIVHVETPDDVQDCSILDGLEVSQCCESIDTNRISFITFIIDGNGNTITTGIKGDLQIPFSCFISQWTLLANQSGSIIVDIWKNSYSNYPPLIGNSITASAKPTISSSIKAQSSTLTDWVTSISAGDILRFNVNSITDCQRVTLTLKLIRT